MQSHYLSIILCALSSVSAVAGASTCKHDALYSSFHDPASSSSASSFCSSYIASTTTVTTTTTAPPESTCMRSVKSPNPANFYCGVQGSVSSPDFISTSVGSFEACRDSCLSDTECISFELDSETGFCGLFGEPVRSMGFTQGQTGFSFYNRHCFIRCPNIVLVTQTVSSTATTQVTTETTTTTASTETDVSVTTATATTETDVSFTTMTVTQVFVTTTTQTVTAYTTSPVTTFLTQTSVVASTSTPPPNRFMARALPALAIARIAAPSMRSTSSACSCLITTAPTVTFTKTVNPRRQESTVTSTVLLTAISTETDTYSLTVTTSTTTTELATATDFETDTVFTTASSGTTTGTVSTLTSTVYSTSVSTVTTTSTSIFYQPAAYCSQQCATFNGVSFQVNCGQECNTNGGINPPQVLTVSSWSDCGTACANNGYCVSFSYYLNQNTNNCALFADNTSTGYLCIAEQANNAVNSGRYTFGQNCPGAQC